MLTRIVRTTQSALTTAVRRYHRLQVDVDAPVPDEPCLIVANHGFGTALDLNVFATLAALTDAGVTRPVTPLVHDFAWTVGFGSIVEAAGGARASRESTIGALAAGHHVLVFPGGDRDSATSFRDRNRVSFFGRDGFARLAMDQGVPIVPVVTAGAGESLLVLSDGQRLARALRLPDVIRTHALPVSVSVPWGLSVHAGYTGYLPLPAKLRTAVLPAHHPEPDEAAPAYAARIEQGMQERMNQLVEARRGPHPAG